ISVSDLSEESWGAAPHLRLEYGTSDGAAKPTSATLIRALYSAEALYLRYDAPYSELSQFEPARLNSERVGLWDRDVVEAFIGTDPKKEKVYYEFEVAPTNEKLDLVITPEIPDVEKRLEWESGWESFVKLDPQAKIWTTVMRIPLRALSTNQPSSGTRWRVNFYRIDRANRAFLAWNPTLNGTFHAPGRFGWLEFMD
ncbi:MAG TPA: carbohydrate-binding family 9-like protein, partial [Verrucomicrobiae bacterium]|nr:carbohydrate-binding family 9-like protein [Verrucomicrobiae bacterium]